MADRPETVTGLEDGVKLVQRRVQNAAERNRSSFEGGRELSYEFDADAGEIQKRRVHGLGRKPKGWFVTDVKTDNVLDTFCLFRTEWDKKTIELQLITANGTGKYAFKVWVF